MINYDNFEKVIKYLEDLPEEQFDFTLMVASWEKKEEERNTLCGTVCCVVGWFPEIFPENVQWCSADDDQFARNHQLSVLEEPATENTPERRFNMGFIAVAERMLDLPAGHAYLLFIPSDGAYISLIENNRDEFERLVECDSYVSSEEQDILREAIGFPPDHAVGLNIDSAWTVDLIKTMRDYVAWMRVQEAR